jgi:hypothetical protein
MKDHVRPVLARRIPTICVLQTIGDLYCCHLYYNGEKKNCFGGTWHLKREYAQDGSKEYLDDASFFFNLIYVLEPAPQSTSVLHETYTQGLYVTDSRARRGIGRREITPTDFKTVEPKHWRRNYGAGLGARGLMHRGRDI